MSLVVVKAQITAMVKELSEEKGYKVDNITTDFAPALDEKVRAIVKKAVERAQQNNRRTLMGRDV